MNDVEILDPQYCNYFVLFYTDDGVSVCVYHMVGFENYPDEHNIKLLVEELKEDDSYGMTVLVNLCNLKVVDRKIGIDIMDEQFIQWD